MNLKFASSMLLMIFSLTPPIDAREAPWVGNTLEGFPYTEIPQGIGPFDYYNALDRQSKLEIVERFHFTIEVEQLIRGRTSTDLVGDIDYTLRAFPKNHRALQAMARYKLKKKRDRNAPYSPAECYFERAININRNDAAVPLIYGIYLHKLGRHKTAFQHYQSAEKLDPDNTELHYNLALLYIDLKQYENAHRYTIKAYKARYTLEGVKNKLKRLGFWKQSSDKSISNLE